jgi:hypothetical protein
MPLGESSAFPSTLGTGMQRNPVRSRRDMAPSAHNHKNGYRTSMAGWNKPNGVDAASRAQVRSGN